MQRDLPENRNDMEEPDQEATIESVAVRVHRPVLLKTGRVGLSSGMEWEW